MRPKESPSVDVFCFCLFVLWIFQSVLPTCEGTDASTASNNGSCTVNDWNAMHNKILQETSSHDRRGAFLAALDQSGGSTPKALELYGISSDSYEDGSEAMYDLVHEMRTRIILSKVFTGENILGAILFENTMDRMVEGVPTATFLWQTKQVVPFLKIDKGLAELENGVQLMKPMPQLDDLLEKAKQNGIYGTKMRSLIHSANPQGIASVVQQQFEVGKQIMGHGLVPIIEPEVSIAAPDKDICEDLLKEQLLQQLDALGENQKVMLKLTIPNKINQYAECVDHPNCICVLALSGGYTQEEANAVLSKQRGMIASFSRALSETLSAQQSDEEFDEALGKSIFSIMAASRS
jgi:fructose-bisphosphate aldolase class I